MSERTNEGQRVIFYQRHVRGETYAEIGQTCGVSLECVRYWCRKQKRGEGVKSHWRVRQPGVLSHFEPVVSQHIQVLRQNHPRWGPISLRMHLEDEPDLKGKRLPSPASIGRFLHHDPVNRRVPHNIVPTTPFVPLTHTHQRWEVDFKVKIRLQGGETVQLHTVTDPFSGAHLGAYLYVSGKNASSVPLRDVQATLRACFTQWGTLPEEIQTDGETALAATRGELPTGFTLWLIGLGVKHRTITPGRPTENGSVERGHRTLNDYSLQGQLHRSPLDLQAYLDACRTELNTRYPSRAKGCHGQPPLIAHPELLSPLQSYQPEYEACRFDLKRVELYLANFHWERKVGKTGQISLAGERERYSVGRDFAQQTVRVHFEPVTHQFIAEQPDEKDQWHEIKRWPAHHWDANHLLWPGEPTPCHCPQQLVLPCIPTDWIFKQVEKVNC